MKLFIRTSLSFLILGGIIVACNWEYAAQILFVKGVVQLGLYLLVVIVANGVGNLLVTFINTRKAGILVFCLLFIPMLIGLDSAISGYLFEKVSAEIGYSIIIGLIAFITDISFIIKVIQTAKIKRASNKKGYRF